MPTNQEQRLYWASNRDAINARRRIKIRERYATDEAYREKRKAISREHLKKKWADGWRPNYRVMSLRFLYGMSETDFEAMWIAQNGLCGICECQLLRNGKSGSRGCVDHDHHTNQVRGLLCSNCNKALGAFEKMDNPKTRQYLAFSPASAVIVST